MTGGGGRCALVAACLAGFASNSSYKHPSLALGEISEMLCCVLFSPLEPALLQEKLARVLVVHNHLIRRETTENTQVSRFIARCQLEKDAVPTNASRHFSPCPVTRPPTSRRCFEERTVSGQKRVRVHQQPGLKPHQRQAKKRVLLHTLLPLSPGRACPQRPPRAPCCGWGP